MTQRLEVRIDFGSGEIPVGRLVREGNRVFFRYAPEYVANCPNLSPLKLVADTNIRVAKTTVPNGLFGVFDDSLPDGWGRLLLDRYLVRQGQRLDEIGPLDRLAYVGTTGRGALTYHPEAPQSVIPQEVQLDEIADEAGRLLREAELETLPELFRLGGSSGGARPKIHVLFNPATNRLLPEVAPVPAGYESWIVKFPSNLDGPLAARMEYAYYQAASAAGLSMTECRLFTGRSGRVYFGTRRFDRPGSGRRLHVHSLAGLLHDDFRHSALDYGHALDAAARLTASRQPYGELLRLAAFNVFTHNRDDHSKNLSFLMSADGEWTLAPAYDLTFSRPAHGEHSMTVAGEGRQPTLHHLRELAAHFDIQRREAILEEVVAAVPSLIEALRELGVAPSVIGAITRLLPS